MEASKGPDSVSMLGALLAQEGSVVQEAFVALGFDPEKLREELKGLKKSLGETLEKETWIVEKATRRAKEEGFPLATDHLLEVIWDEESEAARWLCDRLDPERLEQALNGARYPEEEGEVGLDVPWGHGPGPRLAESRPEPPTSH